MPIAGRLSAVLADQFDLTQYFSSYEMELEAERINVSRFGPKVRKYLSGPQEGTLTLGGYSDFGKDEVDEVLHNAFGREEDVLITLCPESITFGKVAYLTPSVETTKNLSAEVDDATEIEAEFAINAADRGRILQVPVLVTTSATGPWTGNGTAVVDTEATAKGASAHLHVLSVSGGPTSVEVTVEHSADGTTWADLITFDAVSKPGAQRKATLPTATVDEQLRMSYTITGGTTPTVMFVLAVARGN